MCKCNNDKEGYGADDDCDCANAVVKDVLDYVMAMRNANGEMCSMIMMKPG